MTIHRLHRFSAFVIGLFALLHLANHLWAWQGIEAHIAFMDAARTIYRSLPGEALLLLSILVQLGTGTLLLYRNRKLEHRGWDRVQGWAGMYLLFFLFAHTTAILYGRYGYELDTNFYYGAVVMLNPTSRPWFYAYYTLAILSLFVHLGTGLRWYLPEQGRNVLPWLSIGLALLITGIIFFVFSGEHYAIGVPEAYEVVPPF